jgi:ATP-binding cassette subfamily B protein
VLGDYTLLDRDALSTADYERYVKDYPSLAEAPVYMLNELSAEQHTELNGILSRATTITYAIEQQGLAAYLPEGVSLPEGTDPFVFIASLPDAQKALIIQGADEQMAAVPQMLVEQSSIAYVSAEYEAIGIKFVRFAVQLHDASACDGGAGAFGRRCVRLRWATSRRQGIGGLRRDVRLQLFHKVTNFSNIEF